MRRAISSFLEVFFRASLAAGIISASGVHAQEAGEAGHAFHMDANFNQLQSSGTQAPTQQHNAHDIERDDNSEPAAFQLPDPVQNARLQQLLKTLAQAPDSTAALVQLDGLLSEVLEQAQGMADQGRLDEMEDLLRVVHGVNPRKRGLDSAQASLAELRQVEQWLNAADSALASDRLLEPERDSALYFFRQVRTLQPDSESARSGLREVQTLLVQRAQDSARELDFELANEWLAEAAAVFEEQESVLEARIHIRAFQQEQARQIEQDILERLAQGRFNSAEIRLIDLIALGGREERIAGLRKQIDEARLYGNHVPGAVIRDAIAGSSRPAPAVVVIAAGSFLMGAAAGETGASEDEYPQHRVTFTRGFALGRSEVTVAEYRQFIEATRHRTQAEDDGVSSVYDERTGRLTERDGIDWRHDYAGNLAADDAPVLHLSWADAHAYTQWLSEQTGKPYRLPSEAEFEYALRAGSSSPYWWGEGSPGEAPENLAGDGDSSPRERNWSVAFENHQDGHWGPAPTGQFTANDFGLQDMGGNVSEWVMDCWHANYTQAPKDGSAWVNPGCERRVVRGGYWAGSPAQARSAARLFAAAHLHGPRVGFRVARDL